MDAGPISRGFMQEVFGRRSSRSLHYVRRTLMAASRRLVDLAAGVLASERFDFVCVTFLAAHHAGHLFWDPSLLDTDERTRAELAGTLALMYEETDLAVGRVLDVLPDDADIVVVSPLGMSRDVSRVDMLPEMLDRVVSDGRAGDEHDPAEANRIWRLRAALPTSVRAAAARAMGAHFAREMTCRLTMSGIDWRTAEAFVLPSDEFGSIRLNLRGRERDGIVDPESATAVMDRIAEGLVTFRDLGGGPAVDSVDRAAELFPGRSSHLLPDLLVRWADTPSRIDGVRSERYGVVRRRGSGKGRTGGHTGDAFALVLPGGSAARLPGRRLRVTDVATTICVALGLEGKIPQGESMLEPGS